MSHTEGKWETTIIGDCVYVVSGHKEIAIICIKPDTSHLYKPERMEANANLISAAPDFLQACKELIENEPHGVTPYFDEALRKVEAAIAKAEPASSQSPPA